MTLPVVNPISFKFTGQPYDLNTVLSPDQVWAKLDLGAEEVRQDVIALTDVIEADYETKADLTTTRKLSAAGDFTGTLNGVAITSTEPGLSSAFNAHVADSAIDIKHPPTPLVGAKGNANFYDSVSKKYYEDAGFTILATDDTQAIIAIAAISNNLYFPDGNYLITFNPNINGSMYTFTNRNHIRIKGKGAYIVDGNIYTVDALTDVFKFVQCTDVDVDVNFDAIPLLNPTTDLGYRGSSFLYFENNCSFIKVESVINNARYGVRSGSYNDATKGYCHNFDLRLKTYYTGYPTALYLADHINVDIDAEGVHRALYAAGCQQVRGNVSYTGFVLATMAVILTNSLTSVYTIIQDDQRARGCIDVDLNVVDLGSTSPNSTRSMVGLGVQWVAQGTKYGNIKINLQATTTDSNRTLAGFVIQSLTKLIRTEYLYNWENYIAFENIEISGSIDRTAQTLGNSAWGDIYIEGYDADDMTYTHAPTFSNIIFENFIVKKGVAATNNNIIRVPKLSDMLVFRNVIARGINFTISTPSASTKLENCVMNNISSYDTINTLIQIDCTLGTVSTNIVTNYILRDFGVLSGTWTPTLSGSTTAGSNTYSVKKGIYYKVGKLVKLTFLITLSAKDAAMAGNVIITGLPFDAKNSDERAGVSFSYISNVTLSANHTFLTANISSNKLAFFQVGSNLAALDLNVSAISNTSAIWGSITYETA